MTAVAELPRLVVPPHLPPMSGINQLTGRWEIVATTLPFWEGKQRPRVRYTPLPEAPRSWGDTLAWETPAGRTKTLSGVDTPVDGLPGAFDWRGSGLMALFSSRWRFVSADPEGRWAITWFARASFGVTPEGMDVYARDRAEVAPILHGLIDLVQADPRFAHIAGWAPTEG